jgi:hypothetical protein
VGNANPRVSSVKHLVKDNPQILTILHPSALADGIKFKHNFPADGEYRITLTTLTWVHIAIHW